MRRPSIFSGALIGGLLSLPLIALSYLGARLAGLPFIAFDLFEWLSRVLPGRLVIGSIETMVKAIEFLGLGPLSSTAKFIEQIMGILTLVIACVVIGALVALALRGRAGSGRRVGLLAGLVMLIGFAVIEISLNSFSAGALLDLAWVGLLVIAWAVSVGALLDAEPARRPETAVVASTGAATLAATGASLSEMAAAPATPPTPPIADTAPAPVPAAARLSRRTFLLRVAGGAAGLTIVSLAAAQALGGQAKATPATLPNTGAVPATGLQPAAASSSAGAQAAATAVPNATPAGAVAGASAAGSSASASLPAPATPGAGLRDTLLAAPGTRPELTANADFYRIDIDLLPPDVNEATWFADVKGLFDSPRKLTLADLKAFPPVTQTITMSCISNPVAGDLIGTSNWTGARLVDVLKSLGLKPEAKGLFIQAADGFYETVVLQDMMDPRTLLVYAMNGEPLPQDHGFPLRIYIANHYGMKQPKWITGLEAVSQERAGYWVERGWSETAHPQIVSVIDTVAKDHVENGKVPVGGIAWAGDRGIQKVEVQVDDGSWTAAELRTPPLSGLTWIQWRYDWPLVKGTHTFRVRATDGTGTAQISKVADTFPDGATGYHSVTVNL
jgi:DMSO/TMAO reductase YedYZ molybdopterin-dependent catalytic subunit